MDTKVLGDQLIAIARLPKFHKFNSALFIVSLLMLNSA